MEEQEYTELTENNLIPISFIESKSKISKREIQYTEDIGKVLSLLGASDVIVTSTGPQIHYFISDEDHRLELEGYAMSLIRNNLKTVIEVDKRGIKNKRTQL